MNTEWNLSIMYSGLDDPALEEDMNKLVEANQALKAAVERDASGRAASVRVAAVSGFSVRYFGPKEQKVLALNTWI